MSYVPDWVPLGGGTSSRSVPASALYHDPQPLPPPPSTGTTSNSDHGVRDGLTRATRTK